MTTALASYHTIYTLVFTVEKLVESSHTVCVVPDVGVDVEIGNVGACIMVYSI